MSTITINNNQLISQNSDSSCSIKYSDFARELIRHATVRISNLIAAQDRTCDWTKIEPKFEQTSAVLAKINTCLSYDNYQHQDELCNLLAKAIAEVAKLSAKYFIDYASKNGEEITARVDVNFCDFDFQIFFEGRNGREMVKHQPPIAISLSKSNLGEIFKYSQPYYFYGGVDTIFNPTRQNVADVAKKLRNLQYY